MAEDVQGGFMHWLSRIQYDAAGTEFSLPSLQRQEPLSGEQDA